MYEQLSNLHIKLDENKKILLEKFSEIFLEYNLKINLISKKDSDFLFEKHIYDSLAFNLFYEKYCNKKPINLLDIGTGGGFPSMPVSIMFDKINVTAIDSINKKINAIKHFKTELKLRNIMPICTRMEEFNEKNSYYVVTSRAMAELRIILEYAIPFVKTGGFFVAYKALKSEEEIQNAQQALKILNSKIIDKIEYNLPLEEQNNRVLLIIKKLDKTPDIYPRQNGIIKKKPL